MLGTHGSLDNGHRLSFGSTRVDMCEEYKIQVQVTSKLKSLNT